MKATFSIEKDQTKTQTDRVTQNPTLIQRNDIPSRKETPDTLPIGKKMMNPSQREENGDPQWKETGSRPARKKSQNITVKDVTDNDEDKKE